MIVFCCCECRLIAAGVTLEDMANVAIEIDEIKRSRLLSMKDHHQQQFFFMMPSSSSSSNNTSPSPSLQRQSSWNKINLSTAFETMTSKAQQHFMTWSNINVGGSSGSGSGGRVGGGSSQRQQQQGNNSTSNTNERKSIISLWAKSA